MGTATPIKRLNLLPGGDQVVYKLDPPYVMPQDIREYQTMMDHLVDKAGNTIDAVLVSSVDAMYTGPETYIFPYSSDSDEVSDWGELDGSFRGEFDHQRALRGLGEGYEIEGTI